MDPVCHAGSPNVRFMRDDSALDELVHLLEGERAELAVMSNVVPIRHESFAFGNLNESVREGASILLTDVE